MQEILIDDWAIEWMCDYLIEEIYKFDPIFKIGENYGWKYLTKLSAIHYNYTK
jgi:hypothetical protein